MKIYAKQIPPEYQESPLVYGEWPENVATFGNRYYYEHTFDALETVRDAMNDGFIPDPTNGKTWPDEHVSAWMGWFDRVDQLDNGDEKPLLCEGLELLTGQKYEYHTIKGCSQGDWQYVIYPAEYGAEWLECFETEFFNTGEEWKVYEGAPDGDEYFTLYTYGWNDEQRRKEIATAADRENADVVLLRFTGWSRTPEYEEVTA